MQVFGYELVEVLVAGLSILANGQNIYKDFSDLDNINGTMMLILVDSFSYTLISRELPIRMRVFRQQRLK